MSNIKSEYGHGRACHGMWKKNEEKELHLVTSHAVLRILLELCLLQEN